MMSYCYRIFGYAVASEIPLPCFETAAGEEDVRIVLGDVPLSLDAESPITHAFQMTHEACIFEGEDAGRFLVRQGREIVVSPQPGDVYDDLVLFILGAGFGFIMLQRGEFGIHGSMVSIDGKGILLVGDSGAGKSSLAAGVVAAGGKVVSDDLSRLRPAEGRFLVEPGFPSQRIWRHTAEALDISLESRREVTQGFGKYYIDDRHRFMDEAISLDAVVEIRPGPWEDVTIQRLDHGGALDVMLRNTYHYESIRFHDHARAHFGFTAQVASRVPVYGLKRPLQGFTVEQQLEQVMTMLAGKGE